MRLMICGACALMLSACDGDESGSADAGEVRDGGGDTPASSDFDGTGLSDGGGVGTGTGEGGPDADFTSLDDVALADGAGDLGPFDSGGEDAPGDTNEDGLNLADLLEPDGVLDGFLGDVPLGDLIVGDLIVSDVDFDGLGGPDIEDPDAGTGNLDVGSWDGQLGLDGSLVDAPSYLDTNVEGFDIFNPPTGTPTDPPDF